MKKAADLKLLNSINNPNDLKKLSVEQLPEVAQEIREEIIDVVSRYGGHLASSLGAVEIAVGLHYVLDTPKDRVLWDVGHQSYAHKILTGRREAFKNLRQARGVSGFPSKEESEHDPFTTGHSSTSISMGLGLITAAEYCSEERKVAIVIGDAALAGGMAFEALNHTGHTGKQLIVILNDNELSISPTVGALTGYLNRIITNPLYNRARRELEQMLRRIPKVGRRVIKAAKKFEEGLKNLLIPGMLFEEMGFRYFGPIDGHNISTIINTLRNVVKMGEPVIVHMITQKGKGYKYAQETPSKFHSAPPFDIKTGKALKSPSSSYTQVFSDTLIGLAESNEKIVAVTAAMPEGTGMDIFAERFPKRFFDVGIAEQHAVGFAAGLARGGLKPVVAIYSTFLQRAYDQLIHDVCLQNLNVVFALDRAGLVGEDGPTHHGTMDMVYLRSIPRMAVMAPKDMDELRQMLKFAVEYGGPIALRYPRGGDFSKTENRKPKTESIEFGKGEILREGGDAAILGIGSMVYIALEAAEILSKEGIESWVVNARFVKPLDEDLIKKLSASGVRRIITIEEGVLKGGFGSAVLEALERMGIEGVSVRRLGIPDEFIRYGPRGVLLEECGLTSERICDIVREGNSKLSMQN